MSTVELLGQKLQNGLYLERALRLVWRSTPGWTVARVAFLVVQGVLPLASLYLLKRVVDAVKVVRARSCFNWEDPMHACSKCRPSTIGERI